MVVPRGGGLNSTEAWGRGCGTEVPLLPAALRCSEPADSGAGMLPPAPTNGCCPDDGTSGSNHSFSPSFSTL